MSSVEESSLVESQLVPTYELPPEPQTSKERVIHPLEFLIEFKDYGNTLKISRHEKLTKEVSPRLEPSKEWLMEVKCSSKAI
jgi:hypothetical protein